MFANDWDRADYVATFNNQLTPNLAAAAVTLSKLADWADANSDGWAYWAKPRNASRRLTETLQNALDDYRRGRDVPDITTAELRSLYRPIRSFLTRCGNRDELPHPSADIIIEPREA